MSFNRLKVPDQWNSYFTKYPQGYTILEALMEWVSQTDGLIDNVNQWNEYLQDFTKRFDGDIQATVTKILEDWQNSGFLDVVIDQALQTQTDLLEAEQKDFKVGKTAPTYYSSINFPNTNPAFGPIMQGFYFTKDAQNIYSPYIHILDFPDKNSWYLVRSDATGNNLDRMTLLDFGHPTTLGIEEVGGAVYFWTYIESGVTGKKLARFKYEAGKTLTTADVELYNSFGGDEQAYPILNSSHMHLVRNMGTGNSWRIEKRNLVDVKNGIDNIVDSLQIPTNLNYFQGVETDGDRLFWLTGDAYEVGTYQQLLTEFSWKTKEVTAQIDLSFAPVLGNRKEPEGLFVYTDPQTGAKSLFIGIATNDYIQKDNQIRAIHSMINARRFTGMKLQDVPRDIKNYQPQRITGWDGRQLFTFSSGQSIFDTLKTFQGLATGYASSGTTDGADTTQSGRLLINYSSVGTGYIEWFDWQGRGWYVSVTNGTPVKYDGRNTWQRIVSFDLLERPWEDITLLTGVSVGWSYPPQARRIFNRIQLRGCVIGTGSGLKIATLSPSHRPAKQVRLPVVGDGSSDNGRMSIAPTGDITIDFNGLSAVWIECEFDAGIVVE